MAVAIRWPPARAASVFRRAPKRSSSNRRRGIEQSTGVTSAPEADRHQRRVAADHAAAEDEDPAGRHAGYAAEQHAATAIGLLQRNGADLDSHAPRDFAHRRERRQSAGGVGDGFVEAIAVQPAATSPGLRRIGGEME